MRRHATNKLLGRDDLKDSMTNPACWIKTPITLCGRGQIAESIQILRGNRRARAFDRVDLRPAYEIPPFAGPTSLTHLLRYGVVGANNGAVSLLGCRFSAAPPPYYATTSPRAY